MEFKKITEEQFWEIFKPIKNHLDANASFNGFLFETFGPELDYVISMIDENRIVTVLEGEEGEEDEDGETRPDMYFSSGYHMVNRIGYLILDKPYEFDFEIKID